MARHFSEGLFSDPRARTRCDCSSVRYLTNSSGMDELSEVEVGVVAVL